MAPRPIPCDPSILLLEEATVFDDLRVNVMLRRRRQEDWYTVHRAPTLMLFEFVHALEKQRWAYNKRAFAEVARTGATYVGRHAGHCDLFVPINSGGFDLVAGTIARARPTVSDTVERWKWLTGARPRLADPGFSEYLSASLSTLTLEGSLFDDFAELLACFGALLSRVGSAERIVARLKFLRTRLIAARLAERHWEAVVSMVDPRTAFGWTSDARAEERTALGIECVPSHAVVGLLLGRHDGDPIDDFLARDSFQRTCVAEAARRGRILCGKIGSHGVSFLVDHPGKGARARSVLIDLGERVAALARRSGYRLHVGVSDVATVGSPPACHEAALAAAEAALSQGASIVHSGPAPSRNASALRELRSKLAETVLESPSRLPPMVDRYLEVAATRSGYRLEATRAALDAGLGAMLDAIASGGTVEAKGLSELTKETDAAADGACTLRDLVAIYRRAALAIADAVARPTAATRERSLRRAEEHIREHLTDPLRLGQVARLAGYARSHFAELFRKANGTTFAAYVLALRVRRAQRLLSSTTLDLDRIAQMSGLGRRQNLTRAFRRQTGKSPTQYRREGGSRS